jgi:hypothetical protein
VVNGPQELTSDGGVVKETSYKRADAVKLPQKGDKVMAHYTGTLLDGSKVRRMVHGVYGAYCMVLTAWCMLHTAYCILHGAYCMVHGACCLLHHY